MMLKQLKSMWLSYRRRFTPWILFNIKHRESRIVEAIPILPHTPQLEHELYKLCKLLNKGLTALCSSEPFPLIHLKSSFKHETQLYHEVATAIVVREFGFRIGRQESKIPGAGMGVFIMNGHVSAGSVLSLYPGLIYEVGDPLFLQSIRNKFVFRCSDGVLIDGNDKNLSRFMYRSCAGRDIVGGHLTCDVSWLSRHPINPLCVGQFVNNHCTGVSGYEANVAYEEIELPCDFPGEFLKYIPNNFYKSSSEANLVHARKRRVVALFALRDIKAGEELFSNYMTLVSSSDLKSLQK